MQDTWVVSLGKEDPLEKGMTPHSSVLAWRIPGQRRLVDYSLWECDSLSCLEWDGDDLMKQGFRKDSGVIKDTLQHPGPRLSRSEWFPGATGLHPHRGWNTSKVSAFSPLAIILFLVWLEYHPSFQRRSSMHENRFPTFGVKSLWPPLSTSFGNRILESKGICV